MKKTRICLLATTFAGALGVAVAVGVNLANSDPVRAPFRTPLTQAQTPVDLSTANITRRVYFINNDDYWGTKWTASDMAEVYVHAWKRSDDTKKTATPVKATLLMDDVRNGLYYADVTFEGAGSEIGVIITTKNDWSGAQTVDCPIPALNSALADIVYLNPGEDGLEHRYATAGSFGELSESKAAYLISNYKTCSNAYTDGYNGYPQLVKDFWNLPLVDQSTAVTDYDYSVYHGAGDSYGGLTPTASTTIGAKLAAMKSMYDSDGWTVSAYAVPLNYSTNASYTVTPIDDGVNISYTGIVDGSWVNTFASFGADAPSGAKGITVDIINKTSNAVKLSIGFGNGDPFASHLADGPYDWYDGGAKRATIDIGGDGWRNCTFYFEDKATINASILFLDSTREASETTRTGNLDFRNATYIF